jgi:hypothetical protein
MGEISRLLSELEAAIDKIPPSEEQRMARTRLAECGFWLGKCEMFKAPDPIHLVDMPVVEWHDGIISCGASIPFYSGLSKDVLRWLERHSYGSEDWRYKIRLGENGTIMSIAEYLAKTNEP